jgi:hypothetical protein
LRFAPRAFSPFDVVALTMVLRLVLVSCRPDGRADGPLAVVVAVTRAVASMTSTHGRGRCRVSLMDEMSSFRTAWGRCGSSTWLSSPLSWRSLSLVFRPGAVDGSSICGHRKCGVVRPHLFHVASCGPSTSTVGSLSSLESIPFDVRDLRPPSAPYGRAVGVS